MNLRLSTLLGLLCCATAQASSLDPPERVARLSYFIGAVSLQSAGERVSEPAALNWPVSAGDEVITGTDARAELSLGVATLRLDAGTQLQILALDQDLARLHLEAGTASIELRELTRGEPFTLQAGPSTIHLVQPGRYRISVAGDGGARCVVREGEASVDAHLATFQQLVGEEALIAADRTVAIQRASAPDDFDRWGQQRAAEFSGTRAARHLARGVVGYEDLDRYGAWHWEPDYGMVWHPSRVASSWAPYRYGQWIWKQPWGWTWVDDAPWGFAPFHYGRWLYLHAHWYWLPAPRQIPPVYAPALVKWLDRSGDPGEIGWLPLAPREEYVPAYYASERHTRGMNIFANVASHSDFASSLQRADDYESIAATWIDRAAFAEHPLPQRLRVARELSPNSPDEPAAMPGR